MAKIIKAYSLLLLLTALTLVAHADDGEKNKTYSKTYSLRDNQEVKISNKFGKVTVNNWNRKEVKVDVSITVYANDDKVAQNIIDNINIESTEANFISFTTKFSGNNNNKGKNIKMKVNYTVYMPSSNPLSVKNEFGNTYIPDWPGEVNIDQSFGDIETGVLPKVKDIKVQFGSLISKSINDGNMKISYSDLKIDNLSGNITTRIDFCKGSKIGLPSKLDRLDMKISYSDVTLHISPSLDATFTISTSFGDLKNSSKLNLTNETREKKYGPTFDKKYSGKTGSGKAVVNISNSFGDIVLK
ncbi:DUF4097 family beta strand repeat-containing protein [Niabella aquatica]